MIKAVVFDLDHTLFDRYATLTKIMPDFCEHFDMGEGMTVEKATEMLIFADKNFVHINWDTILKYLADNGMFKTVPTITEYTDFLLHSFRYTAVPFSFTVPMLEYLSDNGYKTGLITNGKSLTQRSKLRMLGLEPYFDEIIISGEFGVAKPSTEPFIAMSEFLECEPSEMMYVGDHPKYDVDASRNAGYIPVWVRTTGTWVYPEIEKPEIQIDNVSELPEILEAMSDT